jgi:hypothetical protein
MKKHIIISTFIIIITFILFAFANADFNITAWSFESRSWCAATAGFLIFCYGVMEKSENP